MHVKFCNTMWSAQCPIKDVFESTFRRQTDRHITEFVGAGKTARVCMKCGKVFYGYTSMLPPARNTLHTESVVNMFFQ